MGRSVSHEIVWFLFCNWWSKVLWLKLSLAERLYWLILLSPSSSFSFILVSTFMMLKTFFPPKKKVQYFCGGGVGGRVCCHHWWRRPLGFHPFAWRANPCHCYSAKWKMTTVQGTSATSALASAGSKASLTVSATSIMARGEGGLRILIRAPEVAFLISSETCFTRGLECQFHPCSINVKLKCGIVFISVEDMSSWQFINKLRVTLNSIRNSCNVFRR